MYKHTATLIIPAEKAPAPGKDFLSYFIAHKKDFTVQQFGMLSWIFELTFSNPFYVEFKFTSPLEELPQVNDDDIINYLEGVLASGKVKTKYYKGKLVVEVIQALQE